MTDDYVPPRDDDDTHLMQVLGVHYLELRHFIGDLMKQVDRGVDTNHPLVVTLMLRHGQPHLRCVAGDVTSWVMLPDDRDEGGHRMRELAKAAVTLLADRVDGNLQYEDVL